MSSAAAYRPRNLSERDTLRSHDPSALGRAALLTGRDQRIHLLTIVESEGAAEVRFFIDRQVGITLPAWAEPAIQMFSELLAMEAGWDSYAGASISPASARLALSFLADVMHDNSPLPSFVPTATGGVQLEWHLESGDIEVDFDPRGGAVAYVNDVNSGAELEGPAESLKPRIAEALSQGA
jgi:hypothetical protein